MRETTVTELKASLERGDDLLVVDLREREDYAGWHVPGSVNLPVYDALRDGRTEALTGVASSLPRDRRLVAVCRGGVVSKGAAGLLESLGYDATSLAGGMRAWGGVSSEAAVALGRHPEARLVQIRRNGKGCLSYFLGSRGAAAVFDPSVGIGAYLEIAAREGLEITRVVETHVHADHLSRARELVAATGAKLVLPPNLRVRFPFVPAASGERFTIGDVEVETVATPGHTGESTCYLVAGEALLTGDTLFTESVGRPDLERGATGAEAGARALHASLGLLLSRFGGDVRIYPTHHSRPIPFDGVPVSASIADLRARLALLSASEDEFVRAVLAGLSAKPPNFETVIAINEGRATLGDREPLELEAGPNRCAAT